MDEYGIRWFPTAVHGWGGGLRCQWFSRAHSYMLWYLWGAILQPVLLANRVDNVAHSKKPTLHLYLTYKSCGRLSTIA
jgi:hypothetical protein